MKSRYNDRKSHEEIDNTANLIIEESAPIVSTELVTNTLIPEGREFGLSLGMVMQYPEQVLGENPRANKRAYKEILNNVNTKIIGNIATDDLLADALFHEDLDTDEIKDRISGLKRGEWVVQLPATGFDERKPEILTLKPIPIPPGHSEGPVTVRSQQESVRKRSRDLHCLSNDHELINVEQSIGSANTDEDDDPDLDGASIDGDITAPEHGFLDTVYRALNGQFDDINYDITDSMTEIKDHGNVVESLQEKNLLTTIDAGDDDGDGDSDNGNEEDAPERELEGSNAETIRVGETRNKYYRPHDDAGPLVGRSFNDKIGENGEESLSRSY